VPGRSEDRSTSGERQRTVIVAVAAMGMVQMARDQVVDVIAVRNRLVPAARSMHMIASVATTAMVRGTRRRVGRPDLDIALVDVAVMRVMQVPVVKIVEVVTVSNCVVAAVGTMLMRMILVDAMCRHELSNTYFVHCRRRTSAA
jgi:hypothetical protein